MPASSKGQDYGPHHKRLRPPEDHGVGTRFIASSVTQPTSSPKITAFTRIHPCLRGTGKPARPDARNRVPTPQATSFTRTHPAFGEHAGWRDLTRYIGT